jgi:hypothetical protein
MQRYTVGRNIEGKSDPVTVEAEDALAAAIQAINLRMRSSPTSVSATSGATSAVHTMKWPAGRLTGEIRAVRRERSITTWFVTLENPRKNPTRGMGQVVPEQFTALRSRTG